MSEGRMPVVVGIDPSIRNTAVVCGREPGELAHYVFPSDPKGSDIVSRITRFDLVVQRIDQVLNGWDPDVVLIEGYSNASRGRHNDIAEYGGLLRAMLIRYTGHASECPPSTLKKFATGKGNASKTVVGAKLANRYGVDFDSDDEYDAYALWRGS